MIVTFGEWTVAHPMCQESDVFTTWVNLCKKIYYKLFSLSYIIMSTTETWNLRLHNYTGHLANLAVEEQNT